MRLEKMKLGKPLEIFVNRDGYRYRLVSKVEDVSPGRVCITLIESKSRVFYFHDTDEIEFIYRDAERMWKWSNVKGGITELDGYRLHCFYTDKEGTTYNRRTAYRVFVGEELPMSFCVEEQSEEPKIKRFKGFLKDLSETGVGLFSNEIISLNQDVYFQLPSIYGKLDCIAETVRTLEERQGPYRYYYGCSLTQSDQRLGKYIFYLQRQQLLNARKKEEE